MLDAPRCKVKSSILRHVLLLITKCLYILSLLHNKSKKLLIKGMACEMCPTEWCVLDDDDRPFFFLFSGRAVYDSMYGLYNSTSFL